MDNYIDTIGYGGPAPLAIIFWYKPNYKEERSSYKTVCYDEQEIIDMYKRHTTAGDFYSTLIPSLQMVGEALCVTQTN